MELNLDEREIIALSEYLNHQYISYEKPELLEVVRKIGRAYNELVNESSESTQRARIA